MKITDSMRRHDPELCARLDRLNAALPNPGTDSPTLATIDLDNNRGTGELFWSAEFSGIACRFPNGETETALLGCDPSEAGPSIATCWDRETWNLEWRETPEVEAWSDEVTFPEENNGERLIDSAESKFNDTHYTLGCGDFAAVVWDSHTLYTIKDGSRDITSATAYIPVGSPGYADGKVLVGRLDLEGHGHHEEALRAVIESAHSTLRQLAA